MANDNKLQSLARIIEDTSKLPQARHEAAEEYLKEFFGSKYSLINPAAHILVYQLISDGTDNNALEYAKLYSDKVNKKLTPEILNIATYIFNNTAITPKDERLYNSSLYDEDNAANTYKLKAFSFLAQPRNIQRYGLYKNGDKSDGNLSPSDVLGKNAEEVKEMINSSQTANPHSNNSFEELFQAAGISSNAQLEKFIIDTINNNNKIDDATKKRYIERFSKILSDNNLRRRFLAYEPEESTLKDAVVEYIDTLQSGKTSTTKAYARSDRRNTTTDTGYLFSDFMDQEQLRQNDLVKTFSPLIPTKYKNSTTAHKRRNYILDIQKTNNLYRQLLQQPIDELSLESAFNGLVKFLDAYNAAVIAENRKRRSELLQQEKSANNEIKSRVVDTLRSLGLTSSLANELFTQSYREGMNESEAVTAALRLYNSTTRGDIS